MFVTFSEASFGYQVGVKESHMLILLMTDTAVDNFTKGKMELGGTGGFALGTYGLGVSGTGSSLAATASTSDNLRIDHFCGGRWPDGQWPQPARTVAASRYLRVQDSEWS